MGCVGGGRPSQWAQIAYQRVGKGPPLALPGWFASGPPAELVPLLEQMAADVRPESMKTALLVMAEADLRDLPGAGHVSNLERPELFNAAIFEFCPAHLQG
jgi:pimeloyl-ACP methyl ester carboxylesterase